MTTSRRDFIRNTGLLVVSLRALPLAEADEQRASGLDELPARKRGAHCWVPFCLAISIEACCTASRIAA